MKLPTLNLSDKSINAVGLAIIGAAIVLLIAGIIYYVQQERQTAAIDEQAKQTNELIREVKRLSEVNKTLNEQNRNYTYCNAMLLAKFTQTQQPIIVKDLNKCAFSSFDREEAERLEITPSRPNPVQQQTSNNRSGQTRSPASVTQKPNTPVQQPPVNTPNPVTEESKPSNELLAIGDTVSINTPCLSLLGLIKTCE